jgi:hypothetical protein
MRAKIIIALFCIAVILAWTGLAAAQTAPVTPKVQLPNGETVWDLSGDWEALIENYGPWEQFGTYPNVYRITQTGTTFSAIRLKDSPPPSPNRAGSPSLRGELEKNGFKEVYIVAGGAPIVSKGQISEDGKKMVIEMEATARVTLTRP